VPKEEKVNIRDLEDYFCPACHLLVCRGDDKKVARYVGKNENNNDEYVFYHHYCAKKYGLI